jgi:phage baseplate assembly protein W
MSGISPKLPLVANEREGAGYALNRSIIDSIKQNVRTLVLTSPGEKVMDPEFGCGVRSLLFEQNHERSFGRIKSRIYDQFKIYLPFVELEDVDFGGPNASFESDSNLLTIIINYKILPLDTVDNLEITIPGAI